MSRSIACLLAALLPAIAAPAALADPGCLLCGSDQRTGSAPSIGGTAQTPLEIDLVSGFNFSRFTVPGPGGGVLVEARRSGTAVGAGGALGLVGQVVIRGAPHAALHIDLPRSIVLLNRHGGRIEITRIVHSLPKNPELDANGRLEFSFEGPLSLPEGARPGDYAAAFSIDAAYQ